MAEESFSKASSIRSITFDVDDVDIADNLLPENPCHQVMKDNFFPWRVESVSGQRKLLVGGNDYHQFVFTVHTAYADHRPLVISPGHIWLLICQGFALHVQENAETLRPLFVRFEGKKTLVVERPHFRKGAPDNPWTEVFPEFTRQIDSWLVDEMRDLLVPEFSTTTPVERAAFELTMMDAFESFFGYVTSLCGIPSITLEGTPSDWRSILDRARRLAKYDLNWWIDELIPVLEELLRTSEGHVNREFWQGIYKLHNRSGGPFISGWIVRFFPYRDHGVSADDYEQIRNVVRRISRNTYFDPARNQPPEYEVDLTGIQTIPKGFEFAIGHAGRGIRSVPFRWITHEGDFKMVFAAGFIGATQNHVSKALRPEIDWAVLEPGNRGFG